jgi:hypothetical protein
MNSPARPPSKSVRRGRRKFDVADMGCSKLSWGSQRPIAA